MMDDFSIGYLDGCKETKKKVLELIKSELGKWSVMDDQMMKILIKRIENEI